MSQPNAFVPMNPLAPPGNILDEERGVAGRNLDHLDDSVDVFLQDRGVADDVPLTGGRQRPRPGIFNYIFMALMVGVFVVGVGFPIFSLAYTLYRLFTNPDYYTPEQYLVIFTIIIKLALWAVFLLTTTRNACIQFLSSIFIFVHMAVWDFAHRGGFFTIPSNTKDFPYRVSYFLFYAFIISYIVTAIIFLLVIILVCGLYCWDRRRRTQMAAANRIVLAKLPKITRREWTAKHSAEEVERERAKSLDNCCICYNAIADESFLAEIPVCGHIFHHSCVMEWLDRNPTCPICRDNVVTNLQGGRTARPAPN